MDRLTFSDNVEYYKAQAITSQEGGDQYVKISYLKDGREVSPIPYEDDIIGSSKKKWIKIPVNGKSLSITYKFSQQLEEDDGEWGPAFRSSLTISSIKFNATLPESKAVTGKNKQKKKENSEFAGCEFLPGQHPSLECESISLRPDTTHAFYWSWDVLDGC